jgi:hypothetical protein
LSGQTDLIEIECNDWRNPIILGIVEGFSIQTFDINSILIDSSNTYSLDASDNDALPIYDTTFDYALTYNFTADFSDYTLEF